MANKYLIHGAAYCGDGTASNEAASAGTAGAWNNINVLEGTAPAYGTAPAAGDVVYIRSKTSAGADITRTLTASINIGSASATATAWIRWVLDAGDVWSGVSGTLTYSCPSTYVVTMRGYNEFIASEPDALVFYEANASGSNKSTLTLGKHVRTKNVLLDQSYNTSGNPLFVQSELNSIDVMEDFHHKLARWASKAVEMSGYSTLTYINPKFELIGSTLSVPFFALAPYGGRLELIGGEMYGAGATTGVILFNVMSAAGASMIGFKYPIVMTDTTIRYPYDVATATARIEAVGIDGETGAFLGEGWGTADSRNDGNYPTLDTILPDGAGTPWSWRVYPRDNSLVRQCRLPLSAYYTEADSTKTVSLEMQYADSIFVDRSSIWIDVHYIDSAGNAVFITSKLASATGLDVSTANWSAGTYGPITLVKRKLSVTTPSAIKQDSLVVVVFRTTFKSASANDLFFLNPGVSIT